MVSTAIDGSQHRYTLDTGDAKNHGEISPVVQENLNHIDLRQPLLLPVKPPQSRLHDSVLFRFCTWIKNCSRATWPISRQPSPPCFTTPTPTSPEIVADDSKRTNDSLSQEVASLRKQVENLTRKSNLQEEELERTIKQLKEIIAVAGEESAKRKVAKEFSSCNVSSMLFILFWCFNAKQKKTKEGDGRSESEWIEQDEPGVYITLTSLPGGAKDLKRVRFSSKRFSVKQGEQWWTENRARLYEQYNIRTVDESSVGKN